jgi:hypothetical protein
MLQALSLSTLRLTQVLRVTQAYFMTRGFTACYVYLDHCARSKAIVTTVTIPTLHARRKAHSNAPRKQAQLTSNIPKKH